MIYLDNSATTKPCAEAVAAMTAALTEHWGNPSALYGFGIEAAKKLRTARMQVAAAMGAEPDRVFFTSGGTEADNWALFSTAKRFGKKNKHIITTAVEHHAILHAVQELEKQGFEVTYLQPSSKSEAHRALIAAALKALYGGSHSPVSIRCTDLNEDIEATASCLIALGADVQRDGEELTVTPITVIPPRAELDCGESGSTLRFLLPVCCALGSHPKAPAGFTALLTGHGRLPKRPLSPLYEELVSHGAYLSPMGSNPLVVQGKLTAGDYTVSGGVSSQFISGLLFALPLLEGDSTLTVLPPLESGSYLDLTLSALATFGITVERTDERHFRIPGNQSYLPTEARVEGDYSGAAFFEALSLFACDVRVEGLSENSLQGDRAYRSFYPLLLRGTPTLPISNCPDLGPILMALAAAKNGAVLCGTRRLKIKESDRGAAMAQELAKFGCSVSVHDDSIVVYPVSFHAPTEELDGHNDHRIVMALATLATFTGGRIRGAEAVKKSMPAYFDLMRSLGAEVELYAE